MKKLLLLSIVLLLSACGSKKIEGAYVGTDLMSGKKIILTFNPNGKLTVSDESGKTSGDSGLDYKTDGNKVNVSMGILGIVPITQNDDGSLNAPAILGGLLTKK